MHRIYGQTRKTQTRQTNLHQDCLSFQEVCGFFISRKKEQWKNCQQCLCTSKTAYLGRKEITHIKFSAMRSSTKCLSLYFKEIFDKFSWEDRVWNAAGSYYFSSCDGVHLFYLLLCVFKYNFFKRRKLFLFSFGKKS